jgi:hypothetical protein
MHPKVRQALEAALPHLDRPELIDAVTDALMRDTVILSSEVSVRMQTIYLKAPHYTLEDAITYLLSFGGDALLPVASKKADFILKQYAPPES